MSITGQHIRGNIDIGIGTNISSNANSSNISTITKKFYILDNQGQVLGYVPLYN